MKEKLKDFTVLPKSIQKWFLRIVDPVIEFVVHFNVHPNFFTVLGLIVSIIGAYFFAKHNLRVGAIYILLGGLCDIIDGKVARKTGLSTKFGALFDSSLDRYSEVFMFLGVAMHFVKMDYPSTSIMVFLGLGGSMMVSYVRARAEGLGYACKVGIMQRPERIVYICAGALIHEYILMVVVWMIAILANFTALQRIYHVWNLERMEKENEVRDEHV
jgi:CDP-diacylglycerol--glycerol-3-phosphate 3-phosphatidyltransferase